MKCSPDPLPPRISTQVLGPLLFIIKINIDQVASQCYYVTTLLTGIAYSTASYIPSSNLIIIILKEAIFAR